MNQKTKEQITALVTMFDKTEEEVSAKLAEILKTKQIQDLDKKIQAQVAIKKVLAEYSVEKSRPKGEPVIFRVEAKEEPTSFKSGKSGKTGYRSAVYVTAQRDGSDPFFAVLTLWNDANELNPEMVVGETYTTIAKGTDSTLSMDKPESLTVSDVELPALADIITSTYTEVDICACDMNVSEDWNDLKLLKGIVESSWTFETKADKTMGGLKIMSEDFTDSMVIMFSKMYEQVDLWDSGSTVYVLAQITEAKYDEETGHEIHPAGAFGTLIIPIVGLVKEPEPTEDEEIDEDIDEDIDDEDDFLAEFDDDDEDWG